MDLETSIRELRNDPAKEGLVSKKRTLIKCLLKKPFQSLGINIEESDVPEVCDYFKKNPYLVKGT